MPYIRPETRISLANYRRASSAGELNYTITRMVLQYLQDQGLNYQTCNDIVGALDNAKDEFRRRVQHPYEDSRCGENGDVYP